MRIVGGNLKGRTFSKKLPNTIRPTSELVRESLFNILNNLIDFDSIAVLDICAGTGAFAIESISRGATNCTLIEDNPKVCSIIKDIMNTLNIDKQYYKIINYDAIKFTQNYNPDTNTQFDLIFFDPPYFQDLYHKILDNIIHNNMLKDDGLLIVEFGYNIKINIPSKFNILKEKKYGDTSILILEYQNNNE